jgi:hypothetical protein
MRFRPGTPARSAISVAVAGSAVSAASTRGRTSWRGRALRGEAVTATAGDEERPRDQVAVPAPAARRA